MGPMGRMGRMGPMGHAGLAHSFADAAVLDEFGFETADLAVEQVVGLVDEAEGDVRDHFSGARFAELSDPISVP